MFSIRKKLPYLIVLILALLCSQGATLTWADSDAYCIRYYLNMLEGDRKATFHYDDKSYAQITSQLPALPPLSETPEIATFLGLRNSNDTGNFKYTASEFNELYPHHPNDLSHPQTVIRIIDDDFVVERFDELTNHVVLAREEIRILQASPRIVSNQLSEPLTIRDLFEQTSGEFRAFWGRYYFDKDGSDLNTLRFFRWKGESGTRYRENREIPVNLSSDLYLSGFNEPLKSLKPGMIIRDKDGLAFEVRSANEHGQGTVLLRRVKKVIMTSEDFRDYAKHRVFSAPKAPSQTEGIPSGKPGLLKRLLWRVKERAPEFKNIRVVGQGNAKKIEETTGVLDDFEASKVQINLEEEVLKIKNLPAGTEVFLHQGSENKRYVIGEPNNYLDSVLKGFVSETQEQSGFSKIDRIEIRKPGVEIPQVIVRDISYTTASGEGVWGYYNNSPVIGVTARYEVPFRGGTTPVTIRYPKSANPLTNRRLRSMADDLIAHLPAEHADAQSQILIESGKFHVGTMAQATTSTEGLTEVRVAKMFDSATKSSFLKRLETFWHETGHTIALKLWNSKFQPSAEWARAVVLDGRFITGYSMHQYGLRGMNKNELAEDFAESVSAYLSTDGGRTNPELRQQFSARFSVLDRIFAVPSNQEMLRTTLTSNASRKRIAFSTVALSGGVTAIVITEQKDK